MAKWCNVFNCWCDEVEEIIDYEPACEFDCRNCEECEEIKPRY